MIYPVLVTIICLSGLIFVLSLDAPILFLKLWILLSAVLTWLPMRDFGLQWAGEMTAYAFTLPFALLGMTLKLNGVPLKDFPLAKVILLYFFSLLVGFAYSPVQAFTMWKTFLSMLMLPLLSVYAWYNADSAAKVESLLETIIFAGFLYAPVSIYQYMYHVGGVTGSEYYRVTGIGGWNVTAALYNLLPALLIISRWRKYSGNLISRLYHLTALGLQLVAIGLTFSRTGYIATIISIASLFVVSSTNKGMTRKALVFLSVLILSVVVVEVSPDINARMHGISVSSLETARGTIWAPYVMEGMTKPWFGWGFWAHSLFETSVFGLQKDYDTHSFFIANFYDGGLVGLILTVILLTSLGYWSFRCRSSSLGRVAFAGTLSIVLGSITGTVVLFDSRASTAYWIMVGLMFISCLRINESNFPSEAEGSLFEIHQTFR